MLVVDLWHKQNRRMYSYANTALRQTPELMPKQVVITLCARHKPAVLTELNIVITLFIISSLADRAELCNFVPE
jgi:hypothetical protein